VQRAVSENWQHSEENFSDFDLLDYSPD